jgi:hypothetical protein
VQAAGAAHPTSRVIDVKAQADGGIVRVHGSVDEAELLGEILELVRIVPGVKKEISELDIRPIFPYLAEGSLSFDKHPVVASPHHYRRKIASRPDTPCHEPGSAGCHGQRRLTAVDHGVVGPALNGLAPLV